MTASYRDGILTVTIGMVSEKKESAKKIEVKPASYVWLGSRGA